LEHTTSYNRDHEFNGDLVIGDTTLKYQREGTFQNHGGYVVNFDLHKNTKSETYKQISDLKAGGFLND